MLLDGEDIYGAQSRPGRGAQHHRHGVPASEPVPHHVDSRQRGGRAQAAGRAQQEGHWTRSPSARCSGANLWNEVKDRLDKPGGGLSGGQQQRLCIARAIAV